MSSVAVVLSERLARYGFGDGHPFGPDRHAGLPRRVRSGRVRGGRHAERHGGDHAGRMPARLRAHRGTAPRRTRSRRRLLRVQRLRRGHRVAEACGTEARRLRRHRRASRRRRVLRLEEDAAVVFADLHEDGRYLYPGTGALEERGRGAASGTKLNIPLPPGADDEVFASVWPHVTAHLEKFAPEFIILQCGADSLEGDPITHLRFSPRVHGRAARELAGLADRLGHGRVLALGGGGYNRDNLAQGEHPAVTETVG